MGDRRRRLDAAALSVPAQASSMPAAQPRVRRAFIDPGLDTVGGGGGGRLGGRGPAHLRPWAGGASFDEQLAQERRRGKESNENATGSLSHGGTIIGTEAVPYEQSGDAPGVAFGTIKQAGRAAEALGAHRPPTSRVMRPPAESLGGSDVREGVTSKNVTSLGATSTVSVTYEHPGIGFRHPEVPGVEHRVEQVVDPVMHQLGVGGVGAVGQECHPMTGVSSV
ncbi:MAG: hypothetical protein R2710_02090 [Acidimicrobiales bacterium]